ncbi:ATP-binding protein [Nocardioides lianchengensis]|uniref:Predicted ATPase n=1 Tax=Nocardioides lianchengensis TaxID=1045774 RepID=A0A1G6RQ23_9ACTN|nr:BTAD domain-containing putative transcriptional regulator [Nocardioides lianchengensis]NYG10161.1 putative ATPase/DNA-binding SARP family transcriptional activator/tetratricopeptide (TPR) repeat protein [Nocardioides lianchengensis]SDD06531.1 Predicted ATPase [Nocardioides lianchengensis]
MDLRLLDAVSWRGSPVAGERTHALLAALASAPGEGVSEERLIDEIWGDDVPANPVKALQVVVSRARTATSADAVVRAPHGYRLGPVDSDVTEVRRATLAAHDAERRGDWAGAAAAARIVTGQRIADSGEGELATLRATARTAREAMTRLLGRALSVLGEHEEALTVLDGSAPDEPTLLALLRSEAAVRGVPAALERYDEVRRNLADRLGVDPGPELQALHAELLARDHPVREGLRYDASRLIGRDDDLAALAAMTRSSRLVSIVGPGGLGKTRLAHLLGRRAEQATVHFVELVGVTSPEGVAAEVGDTLGVRDSYVTRVSEAARRTDLLARIVDRIGTAPSLLVLDNCEHVVEAAADLVAQLLARTPQLSVVTTTRSPLGLAAERVYLLPQLGTDDAVELFRERATSARPGVRLDDGEVRSLVERLDGLPLAVELAAARVRVMSVAEITRRLDDRFTLLRGGSRDAPERHQTLLAVIDWSWALLPDDQRAALRRLSVFRDGFALDGAVAVVGSPDALDLVERLVEQSLVTVHETGDGLRYRLLETVREFGRLRLQEAGEEAGATTGLRAWATSLAGALAPQLFTVDQVAVMRAVRVEEGNLVDALRRALADRDADAVVVLAAALMGFWSIEGAHLKVVGMADSVEDVLHDAELRDDLGVVLRAVLSAVVVNAMIFANETSKRAMARLEELGPGDEPRVAGMVRGLLATGGSEDDPAAMEALCDDPDPFVARIALQWACQVYENAGELALARQRGERSLALWTVEDGPWGRALTTAQLASLALSAGDIAEAERLAAAALPDLVALGADEDAGQTRSVFAIAALRSGRVDEAERIFEEIAATDGGQSLMGGAISILCGRAEVALARGQVGEGLASYRAGIAELERRTFPGNALPTGFSPWVLYPSAAALCAHIQSGERASGRSLHAGLVERAGLALDVEAPYLDYPVVGSVVYALGLWELTRPEGPGEHAAALIATADRFAYNRMLPSLDWAWAQQRAEDLVPGALTAAADALGERRPHELRDDVRRLVVRLVP